MLNRLDVSASIAWHIRAILGAARHQADAWNQVSRNVAALTKPPRSERFEGTPISPDDVRSLMAAVAGDDLEALYAIATSVGMRQGELLGLRWRDVDGETDTVNVRYQLAVHDPSTMLAELKTKSSRRTISPPVLDIVRRHHTRQLERRLQSGGAWHDHDIVFCRDYGLPITPTISAGTGRRRRSRPGSRSMCGSTICGTAP